MAERARRDDDFRFEIVKHFGILSSSPRGWNKEFNIVSWNGSSPKYDVREWDPKELRRSPSGSVPQDI